MLQIKTLSQKNVEIRHNDLKGEHAACEGGSKLPACLLGIWAPSPGLGWLNNTNLQGQLIGEIFFVFQNKIPP